ncbi:unnamed protein product [Orchesella dallaii]|uniref:Ionotropic glutamate receptor C-terminal domain-containing protein n=1 Tax=Orchesella dallaii TaxID=48710 RepID=A0ABP1QFP8_9HEXA
MKFLTQIWILPLIFSFTEAFKVEPEIEIILRNNFRNCSLLFISFSIDSNDSTPQLKNPTNFEQLQQDKYVISLKGNSSHPNQFYNQTLDLHKHRESCTCAIISLVGLFGKESYANLVNLYSFLKNLKGIIKSDEDYFIFHSSENSILEQILISEPFALGIKYKLAISSKDKTYKTTCFYCNLGKPSIHQWKIPIHNKKSNQQINLLFPDLLENFHGKVFRISSAVLSSSLTELHLVRSGVWENSRGIFGTALDHLSAKYNFSFTLFPSSGGGSTGLKLKNGSWIGAVGDVLSGRADLGAGVAQIYSRNLYVGYSFPLSYVWLTFTTGVPQRHYSWKAIYLPFTPFLWFCIFLALIAFYIGYSLLLKLSGQSIPTKTKLGYILKTLLEQDAPTFEERPLSSTRTFLAFWLFFALLISATYKSKLVSTLAFPIMVEPPKTFEQLSNTPSSYDIILKSLRGAAYTLLKTSTSPVFHRVFVRMELEEYDVKCFQRAIDGSAACISFNTAVNLILYKNFSDNTGRSPLVKAPDTTSFVPIGYVMKKRALFRLKFDQVLMRSADMGLTEQWWQMDYRFLSKRRKKWEQSVNKPKVLDDGNEDDDDNLTMKHLSGTFYLLIIGLLAAVTCFASEKIGELRKLRKFVISKQIDDMPVDGKCDTVDTTVTTTVIIEKETVEMEKILGGIQEILMNGLLNGKRMSITQETK